MQCVPSLTSQLADDEGMRFSEQYSLIEGSVLSCRQCVHAVNIGSRKGRLAVACRKSVPL